MKTAQNCTNCGAALEFDESEIIDKKYIKCEFCNTMNLIDLDDNSLKSIKNMALHSAKEYKIKKNKEEEYRKTKLGQLENKKQLILTLSLLAGIFGIIIAINMLVALYGATATKDYIIFTILLILSVALSIASGIFASKKYKLFNLLIEAEKKNNKR